MFVVLVFLTVNPVVEVVIGTKKWGKQREASPRLSIIPAGIGSCY
jgi:hypothetical protein